MRVISAFLLLAFTSSAHALFIWYDSDGRKNISTVPRSCIMGRTINPTCSWPDGSTSRPTERRSAVADINERLPSRPVQPVYQERYEDAAVSEEEGIAVKMARERLEEAKQALSQGSGMPRGRGLFSAMAGVTQHGNLQRRVQQAEAELAEAIEQDQKRKHRARLAEAGADEATLDGYEIEDEMDDMKQEMDKLKRSLREAKDELSKVKRRQSPYGN